MALTSHLAVFGGAGMITAAAMLAVNWYLLGKAGGPRSETPLSPPEDWRGPTVLGLFAWGAMLLALGLLACAAGQR